LTDFHSTVVAANLTESEEYKQSRRVSFAKLLAFYELFGKATNLSKLNSSQSEFLIENYL